MGRQSINLRGSAPENLDQVTTASTKHVQVAGMGIAPQGFLDLRRQTVMPRRISVAPTASQRPIPDGTGNHRRRTTSMLGIHAEVYPALVISENRPGDPSLANASRSEIVARNERWLIVDASLDNATIMRH